MPTSAMETVLETYDPIHDIGTTLFIGPDAMARAAEGGWKNPFAYYFAGRGGVLGNVSADVVAASFGWFNPEMVRGMYEEGTAVHGPGAATERMIEANARWGREHLAEVDLAAFVTVAEQLVDGAAGEGRPLFVGWRAQPRADDVSGRAAQLFQVLREWRGANHLVGTCAAGLSALEAILTNEGQGQAKLLGWAEPFPDVSAIKQKHEQAEYMTNQLCAADIDRLLSEEQRAAFVDGVKKARAVLP